MPAQLAREVKRVAKERKLTMSRALVSLAEQGLEAESADRARVATAYDQFLKADDPAARDHAGKQLIEAIFGKDAIAEDPFSKLLRPLWEPILQRVAERAISIGELHAPVGDW